MHRLQNARSIAISALTCRRRAFGVSASVLNANSDADSNQSQSQSQSQIVDLGKDPSQSRETANEQGQQGGHGKGQEYTLGKLSRSLRSQRDSSRSNSSVQNPHHDIPAAGVSKRRKKEKHSKKKKFGSAGARPAVESARASLAGSDAKSAGVLKLLFEGSGETNHVAKDGWTTGWGEDGAFSMNSL